MSYSEFVQSKLSSSPMTGLESVGTLPEAMFPHQRDLVTWALLRGRSAVFAERTVPTNAKAKGEA